jgi:hypothetical protein
VVFNLVITDFGLPKVIGGQYNVLAVDIYKQVIGQQNFEMGAVVSVVLLIPAVVAFTVDRIVQRRQVALISTRSVAFVPKPDTRLRSPLPGLLHAVAVFIVGMLAMCQYAALIKLWPYDLSLSLRNYNFDLMDGGGWAVLLELHRDGAVDRGDRHHGDLSSAPTWSRRSTASDTGRNLFQLLAMMPMAIPGMVLGLAYIFFFNDPANPLSVLYGTLAILVICTVTHFYTVGHLTALTALKQMDGEFESVGLAQAAVVEAVLQGDRAGLPAGDPRHLDLHVRQRHDDGLGGGLPLWSRHQSCLRRGAQHGRRRRHRSGRRHGHDDLLHQRARPHDPPGAEPRRPRPHASLAGAMKAQAQSSPR